MANGDTVGAEVRGSMDVVFSSFGGPWKRMMVKFLNCLTLSCKLFSMRSTANLGYMFQVMSESVILYTKEGGEISFSATGQASRLETS